MTPSMCDCKHYMCTAVQQQGPYRPAAAASLARWACLLLAVVVVYSVDTSANKRDHTHFRY
jgi:hypothetical protein